MNTTFPDSGTPRAFASPFSFVTPHVYDKDACAGLVIEIRHNGGGEWASRTRKPRYRCTNNAAAATATTTDIPIIELECIASVVVPEAGAGYLALLAVPALAFVVSRRRK